MKHLTYLFLEGLMLLLVESNILYNNRKLEEWYGHPY